MKLVVAIWALLYVALPVWVNGATKVPAILRINVKVFYGTRYMSYYRDHKWWATRIIDEAHRLLGLFSVHGTTIKLNVIQHGTFDDSALSQTTTDTLTNQRVPLTESMTDIYVYFAYDVTFKKPVIRKLGLRSSMCGTDRSLTTLVLNEGYATFNILQRALAYYVGMLLGMRSDNSFPFLAYCYSGIMDWTYWNRGTLKRWNDCNAADFKQYVTASTTTLANGKQSRFCCESLPKSLTVQLWASYDSRYKASIPVGGDAKKNIEDTVAEAQKLLNKDGKLGRTFNLALTTNDIIEMANDFNYDPNIQDNMKGPFNSVLKRPSRQVNAGGEFDIYFTYLDAMPIAHASIESAICHNEKSRRAIILTRENFGNFGAARHLAYFIARSFGIEYDDDRYDGSSNTCVDGLMKYKHSTHTLSDGSLQKFGPPSQQLITYYQNRLLTYNQCNAEDLELAFYWRKAVADCFV